jgi:hypothetical protein
MSGRLGGFGKGVGHLCGGLCDLMERIVGRMVTDWLTASGFAHTIAAC